jgi:biopolymer transport protein ExbB/TolQ
MARKMHVEDAANAAPKSSDAPQLMWAQSDIEQRLGFQGARHTGVNNVLSVLMAALFTAAFYLGMSRLEGAYIRVMFCERGAVPYFIVFFTMWSCVILFIKWRKLSLQRRALEISVLPDSSDFILSPTTVGEVLANLYRIADDPRHFVILNRIQIALSNLRNLGRVTDVDEILRSQAERDEMAMETTYSLLRGFVWAIPILGFIGTVLGLSAAVGGFGGMLGTVDDVSQISASLRQVTSGLSVSFETTLEALVAALGIQLAATFLQKSEEEFLDQAREYCLKHIVNRLRMTPFEQPGI